MVLHEKLKQHYVSKESKLALTRAMGYGNSKKGLVTLNEFIEAGSIKVWIQGARYDFNYGNEGFVNALAHQLEIDVSSLIDEAHRCIAVEYECRNTSLAAIIDFERKGETVFMLMAYNKYLIVNYDTHTLIGLRDDEVFTQIKTYAKAHYQKYKGTLPLWGKIQGYTYEHIDGKKYRFDIESILQG